MNTPREISDLPIDPRDKARASIVMSVIAAFAVGQALYLNNGSRDPIALAWIAVAIISLMMAIKPARNWVGRISLKWLLVTCLAVQWTQLLRWGLQMVQQTPTSRWWIVMALIVAGCGAWLMLASSKALSSSKARVAGLGLMIAGHCAAGAFVIHAVPKPYIDVWYVQQESTAALLHGQNPYEVRYRNIYDPDVSMYDPGVCVDGYLIYSHPYLPLTALLATPGRALGDVRWAHLAALEIATVVIALSLAGKYRWWGAAMLLINPCSLFIIHSAWTEPMVLLAILGVMLSAQRKFKHAWFALGLLLAVKQYVVIIFPLVILLLQRPINWRNSILLVMKAGALSMAIALPFILWNPLAFFRSIVLGHVNMPFRMDALSFPAMLAFFSGIRLPAFVGFIAGALAAIWSLRNAPRTPAGFSAATALVLLTFFSFNRQAFFNYYFLVLAVSCCTVAITNSGTAERFTGFDDGDRLHEGKLAA